ncbi:MAG: hypothetical protein KGI27_14585 [Thaumarchaeota archaeon]|nr:hypothetical protein [Nitrososphaerota archaeon]
MKLRKEDIQSISEEPLQLFYHGIKSPVTKEKYTRTLREYSVMSGRYSDRNI